MSFRPRSSPAAPTATEGNRSRLEHVLLAGLHKQLEQLDVDDVGVSRSARGKKAAQPPRRGIQKKNEDEILPVIAKVDNASWTTPALEEARQAYKSGVNALRTWLKSKITFGCGAEVEAAARLAAATNTHPEMQQVLATGMAAIFSERNFKIQQRIKEGLDMHLEEGDDSVIKEITANDKIYVRDFYKNCIQRTFNSIQFLLTDQPCIIEIIAALEDPSLSLMLQRASGERTRTVLVNRLLEDVSLFHGGVEEIEAIKQGAKKFAESDELRGMFNQLDTNTPDVPIDGAMKNWCGPIDAMLLHGKMLHLPLHNIIDRYRNQLKICWDKVERRNQVPFTLGSGGASLYEEFTQLLATGPGTAAAFTSTADHDLETTSSSNMPESADIGDASISWTVGTSNRNVLVISDFKYELVNNKRVKMVATPSYQSGKYYFPINMRDKIASMFELIVQSMLMSATAAAPAVNTPLQQLLQLHVPFKNRKDGRSITETRTHFWEYVKYQILYDEWPQQALTAAVVSKMRELWQPNRVALHRGDRGASPTNVIDEYMRGVNNMQLDGLEGIIHARPEFDQAKRQENYNECITFANIVLTGADWSPKLAHDKSVAVEAEYSNFPTGVIAPMMFSAMLMSQSVEAGEAFVQKNGRVNPARRQMGRGMQDVLQAGNVNANARNNEVAVGRWMQMEVANGDALRNRTGQDQRDPNTRNYYPTLATRMQDFIPTATVLLMLANPTAGFHIPAWIEATANAYLRNAILCTMRFYSRWFVWPFWNLVQGPFGWASLLGIKAECVPVPLQFGYYMLVIFAVFVRPDSYWSQRFRQILWTIGFTAPKTIILTPSKAVAYLAQGFA